ncbi:MAG: hypothetical protein ACRDFS_05145 [Chloroflexota bacterium]
MLTTEPSYSNSTSAQPWSLLSITLISFLLPAGGAILTVHNLQRLRQIDQRRVRVLSTAIVVIFAAGLATLMLVTPIGKDGLPHLDPLVQMVLAAGIPLACYLAQRQPYIAWRVGHPNQRPNPWFRAFLSAIWYEAWVLAASIGAFLVLSSIFPAAG